MRNHAMRVLITRHEAGCGRIGFLALPGRRQDEQEAAVIIVGRKQIGYGLGGKIPLGIDDDSFSETADSPLQGRPDMILASIEVEA